MLFTQDIVAPDRRRSNAVRTAAIQRAVLFMEQHLLEPVTLSQLADIAGLTIFQFNTAFRREVGMPPYRYLSRLRINAAMELLRKGMPTAMVAAEAGFFDQPHMYRHFRRHFGLTPGQLVAGDMCDALAVESGTGRRSAAVPG
jgi:transcriptional regulator GlxA family with amidase domain